MTEHTAASQVAYIETELGYLREKSDADDKMIAILKRQNEIQAMDMAKMAGDHAEEIRKLKQRCDAAVRNEVEISGILNTTAKGIMDGLRKMKGDATPAIMPSAQARPAEHASLPAPDDTEEADAGALRGIFDRLPRNEMPNLIRRG